jgi:hypothetical protein
VIANNKARSAGLAAHGKEVNLELLLVFVR